MCKKIFSSLSLYKFFNLMMLLLFSLMLYNRKVFFCELGVSGLYMFLISTFIVFGVSPSCIFLNYKDIKLRKQINISTYFLLTGFVFLIFNFPNIYRGQLVFSQMNGTFFFVNIGYICFGGYLILKGKIYTHKIKYLMKRTKILSPVLLASFQVFLLNASYFIDLLINNPIARIILAGPDMIN